MVCGSWHGCCSLSSHLDGDLTPQIILTWIWKLSKISVLVKVNIAIMKHHYHSKSGWREFIWLSFPYHYATSEEVRIGTLKGQEPGGRDWGRAHGGVLFTHLVLLPGSVFFPLQPRINSRKWNHQKKKKVFATRFKGQININPLIEDDFNITFSSTYVI